MRLYSEATGAEGFVAVAEGFVAASVVVVVSFAAVAVVVAIPIFPVIHRFLFSYFLAFSFESGKSYRSL